MNTAQKIVINLINEDIIFRDNQFMSKYTLHIIKILQYPCFSCTPYTCSCYVGMKYISMQ